MSENKLLQKSGSSHCSAATPLLTRLCCIGLFFLTGILALLCAPAFDVPIPMFLRELKVFRRFFAWDSLKDSNSNDRNFDPKELRNYLILRQQKQQQKNNNIEEK